MYSPEIRPDLVQRIYAMAKEEGVPMTRWVNSVLEKALFPSQPETENPTERKEDQ